MWYIFRINSSSAKKLIPTLEKARELGCYVYIPTVKILLKNKRNIEITKTYNMLFNYGFIRSEKSPSYMKSNIAIIQDWLYNTANKPREIATVSDEHFLSLVEHFRKIVKSKDLGIKDPQKGDIVTLRLYPFEDLEAEVVLVMPKIKKLVVSIISSQSMGSRVQVSYENVSVPVYSEGEEELILLEDLIENATYTDSIYHPTTNEDGY